MGRDCGCVVHCCVLKSARVPGTWEVPDEYSASEPADRISLVDPGLGHGGLQICCVWGRHPLGSDKMGIKSSLELQASISLSLGVHISCTQGRHQIRLGS